VFTEIEVVSGRSVTQSQPSRGDRRPDGRRWLCIAYAFPPINRSGTHRTLEFVRHLSAVDWPATVLTATPGLEPTDDSLLSWVPPSTSVICVSACHPLDRWRTRWARLHGAEPSLTQSPADAAQPKRRADSRLREWIRALAMTPDSRVGWIAPAVREGLRALRRGRYDLVYSTSPYPSAHLVALILASCSGCPWIADFRDPWGGNPFERPEFPTVARLNEMLEWLVLRRADHVVCCTPTMTSLLRDRFPSVSAKSSTILNGFSRERFEGLTPRRTAPPDHVVLVHAGQFYGLRSPMVWLRALQHVVTSNPELRRRVHLVLIGVDSFAGRSLSDLAFDAGVADCVEVVGHRPHGETLQYMVGADGLILAGAVGPGADLQVPNKLFEYLAIRKPILATGSGVGPVARILSEAGADAWVCAPTDSEAIADAMLRLVRTRRLMPNCNGEGVERFERSHRADELRAVFEQVLENCRRGRKHVLARDSMECAAVRSPGKLAGEAPVFGLSATA
jgi:glycosyltransferase involved in cell wall biosynthesis